MSSHRDYYHDQQEEGRGGEGEGECSAEDATTTILPTVSLDASEALDRIAVMRMQEDSDPYRCVDYFSSHRGDITDDSAARRGAQEDEGNSKPVDAECRTKMCQWCEQVVDFCQFSRETVSVAMSLLDRFLTASVMGRPHHPPHPRAASARRCRKEYQLAAMTALYVAVKLNEPLEMDTELVSEVSRRCYSAREVADMESDMLEALGWRLSGPTPLNFLGHFLALLPLAAARQCRTSTQQRRRRAEEVLLELGRRQTESAASDSALVPFQPSSVAAAALINALDALDDESVMRSEDKVALMRKVRDAAGIDISGEEVYYIRSRLLEAFAAGGTNEIVLNRAESEEVTAKTEGMEEPEPTPEVAHFQGDEPPASERRCSETGAMPEVEVNRSPVCVSE